MGKSNKKDYNAKLLEREHEARLVRRIVAIIISFITFVLIGTAIAGYFYINSALEPVNKQDHSQIKVTIPIGSSVRGIANVLEENGIIKNATVFRYYIKFKNEAGFQAGEYKLSPSMDYGDIIAHLKTGKVMQEAEFTITIPEGKQLEEIATIISKKTNYPEKEVIEKLDNREYIKSLIKKYPSILTEDILKKDIRHPLEGYLFPATFSFFETKPKLDEIIESMLAKTDEIVTPYLDQIDEKGLTVHEFMTMASLIEEEATEKADREKISTVFYNRIKKQMPLQTDPTVLYSLGKHQVGITYKDLKVNSPYNTYKVVGLPPGPIASPGEISMEAAINPADQDYLYFYSRPNGETIFSKTLTEHNNIKNQYKHEWDEFKKDE
ncbi:endolytic transglycosylase MltG [Schinkia sp. CFF1]